MQYRYIQLFIFHVLLLAKLSAGVTVVGAKTGTRDVAGYFNETNTVTITVTLDGDEVSGGSNDMSNTRVTVHYGFNSTNSIDIASSCENGLSGEGWNPQKLLTDNTHTFTFNYTQLGNMKGSSPEGDFFDFTIRFTDGSDHGWVDTDNDGSLDADGISVSASVANNASLVIGGALAGGGSVDFGDDSGINNGRIVTILSAGNDAGISFTVAGTDINGSAQTESITGANAGTATGTKYFNTVTGITAVGNPAGNVSAGVNTKKADKDDIYAVNFNSGANASLKYDLDDPGISVSDPSSNGDYFNTKSFSFTVDEDLLVYDANDRPWNSTLTITGDANGTGLDNGETYVYTFSGTDLQTGGTRTIDVSGIFSPSSGDGSGYDLVFNLYDAAGNNYNPTARHNIIYDATRPTITAITTTENPTTATKKLAETVAFTVNFSENVTADGTMNVTLTSTNSAATATVTSANINNTSTADVTYTVATDNVSDHLNITAIAMATGKFLTDAAGNQMNVFTISGNNLSAVSNFVTDGTIPTITNITSNSADPGRFSTGELVDVRVNFSEPVSLTAGNLDILLETGDPDRTVQIAFSDIDNTNIAVGSYEVQAGDENTTGLTVKSLSVSGGGLIKDAALNATSGYAITGDNLDDSYDFKVETTAPTIGTITSTEADGSYGIGATIPVVVTFINGVGGGAENVNLNSGTFDITMATGSPGAAVTISADWNGSTATGSYVVAEGQASGDLSVSDLAIGGGGTVTDAYGNNLSATPEIPDGANLHHAEEIVIDGTRPTIASITSTTADGTYGIDDDINITITFSEPVVLASGTLDLVLSSGKTLSVTAFSASLTAQATYTVSEGEQTDVLVVNGSPTLAGGATLKDGLDFFANDMAVFTIPGSDNISPAHTIAVDGIKPFVESVTSTSADGTYGIGQTVDIVVTFSEAVTLNGGNILVDLETDAPDGRVTISTIPESPDPDNNPLTVLGTYTVGVGENTTLLAHKEITLSAGTIVDANGNAFANYTISGADISAASTIIIDGVVPPAFSIASVTTDGGNSESSDAAYDDIWNSTNTGAIISVPITDNTLVNGTIQVQGKVTGSYVNVGSVHTITSAEVTAQQADITITKAVVEALTGFANGQSIIFTAIMTDLGNNSTTGSANASESLVIDTTSLKVASITSSTANGDYKLGDGVNIRVNFDGAGTLSGGNLLVSHNASATAFEISTMSNAAFAEGTYSVAVGDEHATLNVNSVALATGATIVDTAGNPNTVFTIPASNNFVDSRANIAVDGIVPTDFTVGTVTTVTEKVRSGYWNAANTQLQVKVYVENDASLEGGTVQILGKTSSTAFANLGAAHTILVTDLDDSVTVTIEASGTSNTDFEEISGFAENETVSISATITDKFGNATTGTTSTTTLIIDQLVPDAGTMITDLITDVPTNSTISVASQGYWNIDTDKLTVAFGDISSRDVNIEDGEVQLFGRINSLSWDTLGTVASITSGNKANFSIALGREGDYGGTQDANAAPYGIEELQSFNSSWTAADGNTIGIKALVFDAAGNSREYTTTSTLLIDEGSRPYINSATADKADGWWGPNSTGLPIKIQINATEAITVDIAAGTPSIKLETGDVDGTATYTSGSGTQNLIFNYTPDLDSYTDDLDFYKNNNEAVISLNGGKMYETSGNLLVFGTETNNTASPKLPYPGSDTSLSHSKNIIIDGINPYHVSSSGQNTMAINSIYPRGDENRTGYYNYRTEQLEFTFYFRSTTNPTVLDHNGDRVDLSLASNDPSLDCNTAAGNDCGTIQIKAEAVPVGDTPVEYGSLGSAVDISYTDLTSGDDYADQIIEFNASPTNSAIGGTDFENLSAAQYNNQFSDGNSLTFKAIITDLAGNQTETAVYGTPIVVDQSPPAPAGTTGSVDTDVDSTSNDVSTANIVSGYWNSHNTGVRITAPLLDDETLVGGAVQILGKVTVNADWTRLGIYSVTSGDYDASYNITSQERVNLTTTVPSATTSLADTVDGNWAGYKGVEEIPDFDEGAQLSFTARVFDVAGNYTDWAASATTLTVDETPPTIKEVRSASVERAYKEGETISINLVTTENITAPRGVGNENSTLELLNTNGVNPTIPFRNASQDTVYYTYLVDSGESSEDTDPLITTADRLNYAATTSLDVKGTGTLIDPAGNNLVTILPTVAGDSALAQKMNIIVDTDAPGVTFNYFETTTATTDSSDSLVSHHDEKLIIHATFTDSIQIDSIPTLAINAPVGQGSDNTIGDIASAAMTPLGDYKYQYEYVLNTTDTVNGYLNITPTAYDKAGNLINQSAVVDSGIIYMDNVHPEFTSFTPDSNSYVNSGKVSYDLSENLDSASITWERIGGSADAIVHAQILQGNELKSGLVENIELHDLNDPPVGLNDGTVYKVTWFAEDSAGNRSNQIATPVTYDLTNPKVYLDYSLDAIKSSELDTIEATFTEPTKSVPRISIDYLTSIVTPGDIDTVNMTIDTLITDSTKWFFIATMPTIGVEICSTNVEIDASDRAGNALLSTNIFHVTGPQNIDTLASDILIVDNSKPICTFSYANTTQNWLTNQSTDFDPDQVYLANGKGQDLIKITASLDEKFGTPNSGFSKPTLDVTFNYQVPPAVSLSFQNSVTSLLKDSLGNELNSITDTPYITNDDSSLVWYLELPDTTNGTMWVKVNGTDRAVNDIKSYVGPRWSSVDYDSSFIIDNFFPDSFSTGAAASYGYNPKSGWINGITDSIGVLVPIPSVATDPSLFYSPTGGLHIELWNKTRGAGWVNIPNLQEPYADSIEVGQTTEFYRSMAEIEAVLVPEAGLVQGDSIYIRAALADRVGNKTSGDSSATIFVYDPYAPTVSNINGGNVLTVDTLYSEENLSASWTGSSDSTYNSIPGSGILNYDYQIGMHNAQGDSLDTLVSWTSAGLNESANLTDLRMRHNHMYSFNIRAVDTAGNVSVTVSSDTIYRKNSAPIISVDSTIIAYEEGLYTDTVRVIDLDLATALSDTFEYFISWKDSIWPTNAEDSVNIDNSGVIRWTPTPQDTGNFRLEVIVVDKDTLSDTLDYPLKILPVNDPPYFRSGDDWDLKYPLLPDLRMPGISFDENDSFEVYLTQYIHDEDNNDTAIVWTYELVGAIVPDSSYPILSPFIGPLTPAQQRTLPSGHQMQNKLKTVETRMSAKSLADTIQIVITQNDTGSTAKIKALYDYNTSNGPHSIVFKASDATLNVNYAGLDTINNDSNEINLNINAINDAPKWKEGFPPDTTMIENDTFRIVFKEFVDDVDDAKLAFKLKATSFENYTIYDSVTGKALSTQPGIMGIDSSVYISYAPGDGDSIARFIPTKLWSGYAEIEAIVTDSIDNPQNPKSDTTIFIIDVIRIPRPYLTFDIIQNNVFTSFYDILITDTISKATNIGLYYGPPYINRITLDQVGPFTYRHHKKFIDDKEGETVSFQVVANAVVGDTVKNGSFEIQLARSLSRWKGFSTDGLFSVTGEPGAVSRDQYILIMDSTMFEKGYRGSYKLGYEAQSFNNPVEISLASYDDEQALYQRNSDNSWTELPSYSQHGRIKAYTEKMGYFRLGRKTVIVPGLTSLGQNYPNPFNPVTNITYDVGFVDGPQQQVNLSIYNILGQHVQTLFRGQRGPGQYSTMWYGRDKSGVSVASGIYFVHMTTSAGEVQTKKVMLLR